MSFIGAAQQASYTTAVAATSAANKAKSGNALPGSGSASETSAANSTAVNISRQAQELAASSQTDASPSGNYNFTNITPDQMRGVAQDLFNSGKIDNQQFVMLLSTGLTLGKLGENGKYISPTEADIASHNNTPMNYVQYSKDRIGYLESAGLTSDPQYGYESWKDLLAILQNTNSGAALSLQGPGQTDANNLAQWEAALANHRTGTPQLVRVDAAIAGGINDIQSTLHQALASNGIDPKSSFSLSYDAANQTYRVDAPPAIKTLLETELNGTKNSTTASAILEGYSLLNDMTSSLAGLHEQFALDQSADSHTASSRHSYAHQFSLGMIDGVLSTRLNKL